MRTKSDYQQCSNCKLSRRCFLAVSSGILASPLLNNVHVGKISQSSSLEILNPGDFRPRPQVRVIGAFLRFPPPYWLGWPGTAYDLEGRRKEYTESLRQASVNLGISLSLMKEPLQTDQQIEEFVRIVQSDKPHAVIVVLQHFGVWGWVDKISRAGVPLIVFAPIGTAFTGHVYEISHRRGVFVISSLEKNAVIQALRMVRGKRQFEESRVLVVVGNERKEETLDIFGTKVRYVPRSTLPEMFDKTPVTDEVKEIARRMQRKAKKVVEPSYSDLINAARSYVAAKELLRQEESNAITTDCLGMVESKSVPTPPCMAASLFQDAGITYGCEADLNGAISLMFTSYVFDKPGFMNDPVPETVKNVLIAAHCVCGTKLRGFDQPPEPFILRSHAESNLGVSLQVLWPIGEPVTLVRFVNPSKVIVDTGVVVGNVSTPPAGGCRTSVEIKMDNIEDVRDVQGFHQVVFYGNHRRDIEAFCQLYGITVTHSPEKSAA